MADILKGKVAVITGGASGIGLGTVKAFLEQGAKVVVGDFDQNAGKTLEEQFGEHVVFKHTDVRDEQQVADLVNTAVSHYGKLDIMFNNAGSAGDPSAILDIKVDGFLDTMNLLLASVVSGHKYAAKQFIAQQSPGSIITTASIAGVQGGFSPVGYVSAKAGIIGLVKQATQELGQYGIRSNAILPGIINTPIIGRTFGVPESQLESFNHIIADRLGTQNPLKRAGSPADIAGAAVFLASDLSAYVSGVALPVDGGITAVTQSQVIDIIQNTAAEFSQG